jgi:mitochondrial fission protein ELM1
MISADDSTINGQKLVIWILYDKGKIGTLRQCESIALPVAKKTGASVSTIDVILPWWMRILVPKITYYFPVRFVQYILTTYCGVKRPFAYPSLIIAGGRRSVLLASCLAKRIKTFVVLNPRCAFDYFDLVIVPNHDLVGKSKYVIETLGALHPHEFKTNRVNQNTKILTVLLGGDSAHYTYRETDFIKLAEYILSHDYREWKIQITASRRTPTYGIDILKSYLIDFDCLFWDATHDGPNPYVDFLETAAEIIVTSDSISMMSEACYFGKPVIIFKLEITDKRFLRFYDALIENQHAVFHDKGRCSAFFPLRERERILPFVMKCIEC